MKVKGRERISFNFLELAKQFISNGESNKNDENIEQEVKKIMEQQDNKFIEKLEKTAVNTGKATGGKRNGSMEIKAKKSKTVERNFSQERKLEEDRERE